MASRREFLMLAGAAVSWPFSAMGQDKNPNVARIKAFYDNLQVAVADRQGGDPRERLSTLSELFMNTFDTATMTRLAVGPRWAKLPPAKKASLQDAFGRYFVATYASRLGQAAGGRFEVLPKTERRTGGTLVRTRVTDAQGNATSVDYLMSGDGRVIDVYLNGTVSELASHRSEFDAALKSGGPDMLEADLRKRADALMSRQ